MNQNGRGKEAVCADSSRIAVGLGGEEKNIWECIVLQAHNKEQRELKLLAYLRMSAKKPSGNYGRREALKEENRIKHRASWVKEDRQKGSGRARFVRKLTIRFLSGAKGERIKRTGRGDAILS